MVLDFAIIFPCTSTFPCCRQPGRAAHLCSLLTAAVSVCSAACCFRCFKCDKILSRSFSPAINHASHLGAGVPCNPQSAQTFLDTVPATRLCLSEFMVPGCNVTPCCCVQDCLWGTFAQSYPAGWWVGGGVVPVGRALAPPWFFLLLMSLWQSSAAGGAFLAALPECCLPEIFINDHCFILDTTTHPFTIISYRLIIKLI